MPLICTLQTILSAEDSMIIKFRSIESHHAGTLSSQKEVKSLSATLYSIPELSMHFGASLSSVSFTLSIQSWTCLVSHWHMRGFPANPIASIETGKHWNISRWIYVILLPDISSWRKSFNPTKAFASTCLILPFLIYKMRKNTILYNIRYGNVVKIFPEISTSLNQFTLFNAENISTSSWLFARFNELSSRQLLKILVMVVNWLSFSFSEPSLGSLTHIPGSNHSILLLPRLRVLRLISPENISPVKLASWFPGRSRFTRFARLEKPPSSENNDKCHKKSGNMPRFENKLPTRDSMTETYCYVSQNRKKSVDLRPAYMRWSGPFTVFEIDIDDYNCISFL